MHGERLGMRRARFVSAVREDASEQMLPFPLSAVGGGLRFSVLITPFRSHAWETLSKGSRLPFAGNLL